MLAELPGLEINYDYTLKGTGSRPAIIIHDSVNLMIDLKLGHHPMPPERVNFDCYYFEIIFIWWKASGKTCDHTSIKTEWIKKNDKNMPEFEVNFPIPNNATDYLIVIGQHLGKNEEEIGTMPSKAMQIMAAGCFKPAGKKLLHAKELARRKRIEIEQMSRVKLKSSVREEVRVRRKN